MRLCWAKWNVFSSMYTSTRESSKNKPAAHFIPVTPCRCNSVDAKRVCRPHHFLAFMNEKPNECSECPPTKPMANLRFLFALSDFLHPQMLSLHPLQLRHRWWWSLKCHCQRMLLSKYNSTYRPAPSPPLPFNHPWRLSSSFFPPNPSHRDFLIHPYIIPVLDA